MNYEAFLQTLPIMGKGMAGIFLVTGVIDFRTWYRISEIYVAVTRIAELV